MSLLRREAKIRGLPERARRSGGSGTPRVGADEALAQSVVWAGTRLRADLVSLMPVDVYRPSAAAGINVRTGTPPVLEAPWQTMDGHPISIGEWLYQGQMSLDRQGNNYGIVRERNALGLPSQIELVNPDDVAIRIKGTQIHEVRVGGKKLDDLANFWHERQFTVAGLPVGLSPIAYAALSLAGGISAQEFAVDWFQNGAVPSAILRNTEKTLTPDQAKVAKDRFAALRNGEVITTGKDWEYVPVQAKAAEAAFLEQMRYTDGDLCRFIGVPGDMVDVAVDSASINYANITQRNLQLLVMNLGASIKRREDALTRLCPGTRFVKLNRDAILAMDAKSRAELFETQIKSRTTTPDEARAKDDKLPLTEADYLQFERLFPYRSGTNQHTQGG